MVRSKCSAPTTGRATYASWPESWTPPTARGDGDLIDVPDLPAAIRGHLASSYNPPPMPPPITPLDRMLEQLERRLIEQALQRARQNKSRAAELLEISRPRLYRRIKSWGFRMSRNRSRMPLTRYRLPGSVDLV